MMMLPRISIQVTFLLACICLSYAQVRPDWRTCHLRKFDRCVDGLEQLARKPNASNLITTNEGLDQWCTAIDNTVECVKKFSRICMVPNQAEFMDLVIEQMYEPGKKICQDNETRALLLQHTPCINSEVLTQPEYHTMCVNDFFAAIYNGSMMYNDSMTENGVEYAINSTEETLTNRLYELGCCSFNRFRTCANDAITAKCGADAVTQMESLVTGTAGFYYNLICNPQIFDPMNETRTAVMPPKGSDPHFDVQFNNPLGKYSFPYFNIIYNFAYETDEIAG